MNRVDGYIGFELLSETIQKYADGANHVVDVLELGAKEFINDALKLPKPISKIHKIGYTHLVRSFAYKRKNEEIEAGWGKYYGPIIENGGKNIDPQPHLYPLWEKNKEKYYKAMLTKLGIKNW